MDYLCVSLGSIILYAYVIPVVDSMTNLAITYFTTKRAKLDLLIEEIKIEAEKKHMNLEKYKFELESDLQKSDIQVTGFRQEPSYPEFDFEEIEEKQG